MRRVKGLYRELVRKLIIAPALGDLEDRFTNYHRNRWDAIDNLADYLVGAEVPGDYMEFGVAKGTTFAYACRKMAFLDSMRFIAFDSFEGLPEPRGVDARGGYTSTFFKGQFAYPEDRFIADLAKAGADTSRVLTVKGWFDRSLTGGNPGLVGIDRAAAAWIDCDLYESTVPVLRFLTGRLSVGSVILFDDWRCFRNLPDYGEQRACREWLEANPNITLHELFSFGWHGVAFTVGSC
jgi:hypothetical protein